MQREPGKYLVAYNYEGAEWNFEIDAESMEDATRRVRQLAYARLEGRSVAKVHPSVGFLAPLIAWVRNLIGRL